MNRDVASPIALRASGAAQGVRAGCFMMTTIIMTTTTRFRGASG
jgi:hypothetical protein